MPLMRYERNNMQLKKIALVFLVVMMMFSLAAIGIAAEEADAKVSLSAKAEAETSLSDEIIAVKPGEEITVTFSIDSNPGKLAGVSVRLSFDDNALVFKSVTTEDYGDIFEKNAIATGGGTTQNGAQIQCWLFAKSQEYASDKTGEFVTFKFQVKDDFEGNIGDFVVTEARYALYEGESDSYVSVSIPRMPVGMAHNFGDPTNVPGDCVNPEMLVYACTTPGCKGKLEVPSGSYGEHVCETLIPAKDADCNNPGNVAHYVCGNSDCGKYIAADKTTVLDTVVIEQEEHAYGVLVPAVEPTTEHEGNVSYYQCSSCQKYFDADKNEITSPVIAKLVPEGANVAAIIIVVVAVIVIVAGAAAAIVVLKKKNII